MFSFYNTPLKRRRARGLKCQRFFSNCLRQNPLQIPRESERTCLAARVRQNWTFFPKPGRDRMPWHQRPEKTAEITLKSEEELKFSGKSVQIVEKMQTRPRHRRSRRSFDNGTWRLTSEDVEGYLRTLLRASSREGYSPLLTGGAVAPCLVWYLLCL